MRTVLVVEDDVTTRTVLTYVLTGEGFDTLVATTQEEAARYMESHEPDAAIIDLRMPGYWGDELAHRMHRRWPEMPILVAVDREQLERGRTLPPCAWVLTTPLDVERLAVVLRMLTETSVPRSPGTATQHA